MLGTILHTFNYITVWLIFHKLLNYYCLYVRDDTRLATKMLSKIHKFTKLRNGYILQRHINGNHLESFKKKTKGIALTTIYEMNTLPFGHINT